MEIDIKKKTVFKYLIKYVALTLWTFSININALITYQNSAIIFIFTQKIKTFQS